jgi:hypothetical protein
MSMKALKDTLLSLKLRENLFTVCYIVDTAVWQFFDVKSKNDNWYEEKPVTLKPLFRLYVGRAANSLIASKLNSDEYIFDKEPKEVLWIRPKINFENNGFAFKGGDLVSVLPTKDYVDAPVVKADLTLPDDRGLIEKYELVNMWGADDLKERLIRYFEKGIDRDDLKFEIFPNLWNDRELLKPLTSRLPVPLR